MYVCVCMYAHTNTCTWYIFACTCMFTYTSITTLFSSYYAFVWASQVAQLVKNPPAVQETSSSIPGLGSSPEEGIGYPLQDSWASLVAQLVKKSESEVAQSCPTLCDPTDCSLLGFSIHGIFQATVLEWGAISFSRGSS